MADDGAAIGNYGSFEDGDTHGHQTSNLQNESQGARIPKTNSPVVSKTKIVHSDIENARFQQQLDGLLASREGKSELHLFGCPEKARHPGRRLLHGILRTTENGVKHVAGYWRHIFGHVHGPMRQGKFEMTLEPQNGDEWATIVEPDSSRKSIRLDLDAKKVSTHRNCVSDVVNSHWMTEYGLVTAWLFAVLTVAQALMFDEFHDRPKKFHIVLVDLACNIVYALVYISFLASYAFMDRLPDRLYVYGIALYTLGYIIFALAGYLLILSVTNAEDREMYEKGAFLGSCCFLIGSSMLVVSTMPSMGHPFLGHSASLFWGSVAFFVGSVFFIFASLGPQWRYLRPTLTGYIIFSVGRFFFVDGSGYGSSEKAKAVLRDDIAKAAHVSESCHAGLSTHTLHFLKDD
eukprot:CAMPEP_0184478956 /NCGR_PEP_ID=MMETSP0113_2-20130426/842_1 /TAXON_ID=91329 /ORGANISM="Norrisiella sphaerica, Strain BC52" /LENGTH=403 /DNA_ID=CAMNT_0026856913 /DNA_START=179 /DNA_END=1390 /DNA_ORIENTATION=+